MSDDKFHFEIPDDNIRNEKFEKTAGGTSFKRQDYAEHGKKLLDKTLELKSTNQQKKDYRFSSDIVLQVATPDTIPIKSEKIRLQNAGFDLLSISKTNPSIGTAKISKSKFTLLENKLTNYIETDDNTGKSYLSIIEDFTDVPISNKIEPEIDISSNVELAVIFNLYNFLNNREKKAISESVVRDLENYGREVTTRQFSNGVLSIACIIPQNIIPTIAAGYSTIKEVKQNFIVYVENSITTDPLPNPLTIPTAQSDSVIGITDSGIFSSNKVFQNVVIAVEKFLPKGSTKPSLSHGTFVASRCVFGDNIDLCLSTHQLVPKFKLLDVQVFGIDYKGNPTYPTEFDLRDAIEKTVQKYHSTVRVYNLSLGCSNSIRNDEVSELAKLLDYLSKRYKVLFIVAAGNMNQLLGPYPTQHFQNPNSRIGFPAESLISLTVGSISKHNTPQALAQINEISPFSRIGPGFDGGLKPELVAHGGNLIHKYSPLPRIATYGISENCLNLAVDNGTSFAAPLISQYAQTLFDLYPTSSPNLIRALLLHFNEIRFMPSGLSGNARVYTGFGEPNIELAKLSGANSAAYIYEGRLDQENYQYIGFDIPKILSPGNTDSKLKIKVTVVYDPEVNPDNELEYSKARISACIFKRSESELKAVNISAEETYNLPWNPIIQFERKFARNYSPGRWEIRLRLYTRGNIASTYMQDYAIIVEVIDENKKVDVYTEILKEFGNNYRNVKVRLAA